MLDPRSEALGAEQSQEELELRRRPCARLLDQFIFGDRRANVTSDAWSTRLIRLRKYFPDYDTVPLSQEKFYEDWSHDITHMWQQNRGVIGHNLKIAWNLYAHEQLASPNRSTKRWRAESPQRCPQVGGDQQRGGWYDVMERMLRREEEEHRFAFHDRKAWWQQEQGILAYLILHGMLGDAEYLRIGPRVSRFLQRLFPGS